jgi:hypothetical protein
MADAGEGLIDAQNRIQERMDERQEERARRANQKADHDPERIRRAESLRLAHTELSRQLATTTHTTRKQQLTSALAELDQQLKALGSRAH